MATIDLACEYGARRQRDRADGQAQLFGGASQDEGGADEAPMGPVNVEPWTEVQQLAYEKESLGLYFSGHPIDRVAAELKGFGAKTTAETGGRWVQRVQWVQWVQWVRRVQSGAAGLPTERHQPRRWVRPPSAANGYRRDKGVDVTIGGIIASIRPVENAQGRSHGGHHARRSRTAASRS